MDEQFSSTPQHEADAQDEMTEATETTEAVETSTPQAQSEEDVEETETVEDEEKEEDDPLAGAFQYDQPQQPKKRTWPIVLLAVLLVLVFVGGMLWAFGAFDKKAKPTTDDGTTSPTSTGSALTFGTADVSDLLAAESANFQMTNGMFAFNMESSYLSFQNQYSFYLSSLGVDPTASLKGQAAYEGDGSWFDYFRSYAKNDAEWMLVMSEAAAVDGTTAPDTAAAQIESYLDSVDFSVFHNGVTREDGKALLQMYYTALAQEDALFNAMQYTEAETEAYYAAHKTDFDVCSYAIFALSIGEDGDFATAEDAAATVAKLTACKTPAEFRRAVAAYLVSTGKYDTEDAAAAAYDSSCVRDGVSYSADDGISDWLFDAATTVGSTKTLQTDTAIGVYMLTAAAGRDTSKTVNVRHILLSAATYGTDDAAAAKADELLNEWKAGEATAASFGQLAAQYTEDSNGSAGGLYEGVPEGAMVTEFNDWCFDTGRKPGDTGVVKTSYGYHVMYFEGSQEAWISDVQNEMKNAAYDAQYKAYQAQYPVTFYDDNIDQNDM